MAENLSSRFPRSELYSIAVIFVVFLLLRIPGLDLQYHQDEYKYVAYANPAITIPGNVPHPPLSELLFVNAGKLFGYERLRLMPFSFSIISFFLLYLFVRYRFGRREAIWSAGVYAVLFYSVFASLMVDTDGMVLPTFFLLALIGFDRWQQALNTKARWGWGILTALALTAGFLTKLSFGLAIGVIGLEWIVLNWKRLWQPKFLITYGILLCGFLTFLGLALWNGHLIYPPFDRSLLFSYSGHFGGFFDKNYLQIFIQFLKSLLYLSPLALASVFLITRRNFPKIRVLILYISASLIFYLGLFDFSSGALDRYFMMWIVPCAIVLGVGISQASFRWNKYLLIVPCIILFLQFVPHYVPALYPKTAWFERILQFRWNFLFPFTGGSGPLGFYVSWLFLGGAWIVVGILALLAFFRTAWRGHALTAILSIGILYNFVMTEEYLFGKINGNAEAIVVRAQEYIRDNPKITQVITYNDIGAYELRKMGKYYRRIYVAPKFPFYGEGGYNELLRDFKGHYLVIDIPRIDPKSPFADFFARCKSIYHEQSGKISANIYTCAE